MAENTVEEYFDNPTNNQSENTHDEIIAAADAHNIKPDQETENMEVHHHPQVEKKNLKEYLLEGLMIFLAVTMGFIAENVREQINESHHENEFAKELYSELKDDSTIAANKLFIRIEKEKDMDYLNSYFQDSSLTNLSKNFYPAFTTGLYMTNVYFFEPKDGILSQLKSSGSLRYFKSIALQKLLGDISVCINNMRNRNDEEYQFFGSPVKQFLLKYYDFQWLDQLRNENKINFLPDIVNNYRKGSYTIEGSILNSASLNRDEARNMLLFYKQLLVSTQSLQMNSYIITNHKILQVLRENYSLKNE